MHTNTCNVQFCFYICTNKNEMCNKNHFSDVKEIA